MQPSRDLARLPKAHLHLHFTGSLRISTLAEMAAAQRIALPGVLLDSHPLQVRWRRARLVPVPAPLRRRACVRARRGRPAPPGRRGGGRRRRGGFGSPGDPGRPDELRALGRRDHAGPGDRARRGPGRLGPAPPGGGGGRRSVADAPPARRPHAGPARRPARRGGAGRGGRLRAVQRRAARRHGRVRARVRDRPAGRTGVGAARRGAARPGARHRGARPPGAGPARSRRAGRRGPGGAGPRGRRRGRVRGVPIVERVARRLLVGRARAAAHAARRGCDRRARRRRPAAVPRPPGRPVRAGAARPRPVRRGDRRPGARLDPRQPGLVGHQGAAAGRGGRLARHPDAATG